MIINSRHEFYKSPEWAICKLDVLDKRTKEDGMVYCEYCGEPIMRVFDPQAGKKTDEKAPNRNAMVFHHTIELTDTNYMDYNISLNPDLIQILHWKCHNKVHNRFQGGTPKKKVYIVNGAVCSGKSTFVKDNAEVGDVILDLDLIWQAISLQPLHSKPNALKPIVFAVRDTIIDQIKMRSGMWQNAWIITTQSRPMEVERMADRLNAEIITMDTPKEVCLERLYNNPNNRDIQLYTKLIDEYYENREVQ